MDLYTRGLLLAGFFASMLILAGIALMVGRAAERSKIAYDRFDVGKGRKRKKRKKRPKSRTKTKTPTSRTIPGLRGKKTPTGETTTSETLTPDAPTEQEPETLSPSHPQENITSAPFHEELPTIQPTTTPTASPFATETPDDPTETDTKW